MRGPEAEIGGRHAVAANVGGLAFEYDAAFKHADDMVGDAEGAVWDLPRWWHRRRAARVLVVDGVERPLDTSMRIGRSSSCDLVLEDDSISRRHAEIALRGGVCVIRDLGSCNGTWVNGRAVRRARLRRGDELQLGETVIRLR